MEALQGNEEDWLESEGFMFLPQDMPVLLLTSIDEDYVTNAVNDFIDRQKMALPTISRRYALATYWFDRINSYRPKERDV